MYASKMSIFHTNYIESEKKKKPQQMGMHEERGKKSFLYTQNLMSRDKNKMRSQISMSTNPKKGKKIIMVASFVELHYKKIKR